MIKSTMKRGSLFVILLLLSLGFFKGYAQNKLKVVFKKDKKEADLIAYLVYEGKRIDSLKTYLENGDQLKHVGEYVYLSKRPPIVIPLGTHAEFKFKKYRISHSRFELIHKASIKIDDCNFSKRGNLTESILRRDHEQFNFFFTKKGLTWRYTVYEKNKKGIFTANTTEKQISYKEVDFETFPKIICQDLKTVFTTQCQLCQ